MGVSSPPCVFDPPNMTNIITVAIMIDAIRLMAVVDLCAALWTWPRSSAGLPVIVCLGVCQF